MRLPDGKTAILYSVYEAVSNSIHAINDRFSEANAASKGKVHVDISVDDHDDIDSISITDNGIGFTPENTPSHIMPRALAKPINRPTRRMMGFAEPVIGPATSGRTRWLYPSYALRAAPPRHSIRLRLLCKLQQAFWLARFFAKRDRDVRIKRRRAATFAGRPVLQRRDESRLGAGRGAVLRAPQCGFAGAYLCALRIGRSVHVRQAFGGQAKRARQAHCGCGKSGIIAARLSAKGSIALLVFRRALLVHLHRVSTERVVKGNISQRQPDLVFS